MYTAPATGLLWIFAGEGAEGHVGSGTRLHLVPLKRPVLLASMRRVVLSLPSIAAVLALAAATGCDDAPLVSECVPGVDPTCETPTPGDQIVAGVNLTALFASPTTEEVAAARQAPAPTTATATLTQLVAFDTYRRFTLAFDQGGERLFTAFVRVPGGADQTTRLRTLVILTDGTDGAAEADLLTDASFGSLVTDAVQIVVAYRGEALGLFGPPPIDSDVAPDPYRADVADLGALLAALPTVPRADAGRIGLVGIGRGGTVALLAALYGAPAESVVTLGAPTDLFAASFRADVRTELLGQTPTDPFPAFQSLVAPVLQLRDGVTPRDVTRQSLLEVSPARLAAGRPLPAIFALHAVGDRVVGDDQLASLGAVLTSSSDTPRGTLLVEDTSHDGLLDVPTVQSQIAAFFGQTL